MRHPGLPSLTLVQSGSAGAAQIRLLEPVEREQFPLDPAEFGVQPKAVPGSSSYGYYLRVRAVGGAIAGRLGIACSLYFAY